MDDHNSHYIVTISWWWMMIDDWWSQSRGLKKFMGTRFLICSQHVDPIPIWKIPSRRAWIPRWIRCSTLSTGLWRSDSCRHCVWRVWTRCGKPAMNCHEPSPIFTFGLWTWYTGIHGIPLFGMQFYGSIQAFSWIACLLQGLYQARLPAGPWFWYDLITRVTFALKPNDAILLSRTGFVDLRGRA